MKFILIFTLFISTYSIGASSHAATSAWEGWSVTELATFLQYNSRRINGLSTALQYKFNSTHATNIKEALANLHRQYTDAVVSCAKAFYDALFLQEKTVLSYQPLPAFKKDDLFKNDKFHPDLERLIKKHSTQSPMWNPCLDELQDYFNHVGVLHNDSHEITYIEIPLYIESKSSHQLTQKHISKRDVNALSPTERTLAFNKDALRTTDTGAVFIYAKIAVHPMKILFKTLSFIAYETKPSPTSPLKARPKDMAFCQKMEKKCAELAKLSKKINESASQQQPDPSSKSTTPEETSDITRQEPPTGILVNF